MTISPKVIEPFVALARDFVALVQNPDGLRALGPQAIARHLALLYAEAVKFDASRTLLVAWTQPGEPLSVVIDLEGLATIAGDAEVEPELLLTTVPSRP